MRNAKYDVRNTNDYSLPPLLPLFFVRSYPDGKPGRTDSLASAEKTSPRRGESLSLSKNMPAIPADGRDKNKLSSYRTGPGNMDQVIIDLFLPEADSLRNFFSR
jgi:hypothetical protein